MRVGILAPPYSPSSSVISRLASGWVKRSLDPLPDRLVDSACRAGRIGVFEFVRGQRADDAFLVAPVQIRISGRLDVGREGLRGFIDRPCPEVRDHALHDSRVL